MQNITTKKLLIIGVIAIIGFNFLQKEAKKNFEKAVVEAVKNNPEAIKTALGGPPPEENPSPQVPPSQEEQFKQQLADRIAVDIGNTPILGSKDAPIKLVVFSDFQCPFSKRGADTVNALKQKYGNKLMFVYKNLPLGFHPEAMPSAKAALAAGRQGKFYEFHDKLYENQDTLGEALYLKIATELGLNMKRFNTDRNSPAIESQIKADAEQASKLGFNGTPGFALNGVKVLGAYPVEHFEKIISALGVG